MMNIPNELFYKSVNLIKHLWVLESNPIFKIKSIDIDEDKSGYPIIHIIKIKTNMSMYKNIYELYNSELLKYFSSQDIALIGYTYGNFVSKTGIRNAN